MATLFRTFTINWVEKRLQLSPVNGGELVFPSLNKYECVPFRWYIVEPDPDQLGWSKIPLDNLSLTVTVTDIYDDATPLAQQTVWAKELSTNSFLGELDMNTAAMNAYLASNPVTNLRMSVVLSEGTARSEIWQAPITVVGSLIAPIYTSPDPLLRFITYDEAQSMFVKFINAAGLQFTITSPGGNKQRIFGVTDGGTRTDDVVDV